MSPTRFKSRAETSFIDKAKPAPEAWVCQGAATRAGCAGSLDRPKPPATATTTYVDEG